MNKARKTMMNDKVRGSNEPMTRIRACYSESLNPCSFFHFIIYEVTPRAQNKSIMAETGHRHNADKLLSARVAGKTPINFITEPCPHI